MASHSKILLTSDFHCGYSPYTYSILEDFFKDIAKTDKPDLLLVAGDMVQHPDHMEPCIKLIRDALPEIPVLVVLGNHDWWSSKATWKRWSFERLFMHYNKLFEQYNITWLENQSYKFNGVTFYGFDGWYAGDVTGKTYDDCWMSSELMEYLHHRAISSEAWMLDKIKNDKPEKTVVLTHFDFTDHFMSGDHKFADDLAKAGVGIICCGHSHHHKEDIWDIPDGIGPSILNSGSDYDNPKKLIFLV